MTRKEVLDAVSPLNREERTRWLIWLGWQMTIAARAGYPDAKQADSILHLMAFNELQHQLYNYLGHSQTKDDWTIEELLEGLHQKASASGVAGHFGAALNSSLRAITG
jgi:hypothetical protein